MGLRGSTESGKSAQRVMLVPSRENRRCARPALPYGSKNPVCSSGLSSELAARRAGTDDSLITSSDKSCREVAPVLENVLSEAGTSYVFLLSSRLWSDSRTQDVLPLRPRNCRTGERRRCRCDFRFANFCRLRSRGCFLFNIAWNDMIVCVAASSRRGSPHSQPLVFRLPSDTHKTTGYEKGGAFPQTPASRTPRHARWPARLHYQLGVKAGAEWPAWTGRGV